MSEYTQEDYEHDTEFARSIWEERTGETETFDRWLAEVERAAKEEAVGEFRELIRTELTAPAPNLSMTVGGQECLATSIIEVVIDEVPNPYRRKGGENDGDRP